MKVIHRTLTSEELEEFRFLESKLRALDSGSVSLSMEEAVKIVDEHRGFWIYLFETYSDQLDPEEHYEIDTVLGHVSVDPA